MPNEMKGLIDEIQSPSYSTVIGLARYGAATAPATKQSAFGLGLPKVSGNSGKMLNRIIDIVKSFIP